MLWDKHRRNKLQSLNIKIEIGFVFELKIDLTTITFISSRIKSPLSIKQSKLQITPKTCADNPSIEKTNSRCPSSTSTVFVITKNLQA